MSILETRLAAGAFVVTGELPTVDSGGREAVRDRLRPMEDYVDAVNATDNTAAHAHASSLAVAATLLSLGVEPIMQLVCRDRNRLALQADIVGAALLGIENICCLTGDDVTAGDEPETRRVFDLDSSQLLSTARSLAQGRYLSGRTLSPAPRLFLGAVENPGAPPFEYRVERAQKKAAAGARFLQLQICFDPQLLSRFMNQAARSGLSGRVALIPSICLVRSAKALRFISKGIPGIAVNSALIDRVESSSDPEEECLKVACELAAEALRLPGTAGLHLISFRNDDGVARLCKHLGIPPRHERESHGYRPALAV